MTINPLTISLMIVMGLVLYVLAGYLTWRFLYYVRKWQASYEEDGRFMLCVIWPFTMLFWVLFYSIVFVYRLIAYPFNKIENNVKIKKARIQRSGKTPRIVK